MGLPCMVPATFTMRQLAVGEHGRNAEGMEGTMRVMGLEKGEFEIRMRQQYFLELSIPLG